MNIKKHKARMGRPPKPKTEKYSAQIVVHLTEYERKILESEARKAGLSLGALLMRPWRP